MKAVTVAQNAAQWQCLTQVSDLGMHALKGQQHLAQGSALGNGFPWDYALKGQKH